VRAVAVALALILSGGAGDVRAQPADWGPQRDPFDRGVIARYQAILARLSSTGGPVRVPERRLA
jgi:hypothetical protein